MFIIQVYIEIKVCNYITMKLPEITLSQLTLPPPIITTHSTREDLLPSSYRRPAPFNTHKCQP